MFYQFNHLGSPDYLKVESGKNFSFPPHLHQSFEIIIIISGSMKVTIDGKENVLKKGQAVMIFPNQIHELISTQSEHILCIFSPKLVQAYATKIAKKTPEKSTFFPDEYFIGALKKLDLTSSTVEKKGLLYSLCAQFDTSTQYMARKSDSENLLYKIFSYVENNFSGECHLSNLSDEIGYDYSYLSRYFKRVIGISFNSYVTHYRISHACYLMENTQLPIIHCASESGFTSLRSFNRCFKDNLKITPSQYRKNIIL